MGSSGRGEGVATDNSEPPAVSSRLLYMGSLLDVLRSAGGTLPSKEAAFNLIESGLARQADLDTVQPSRETRFAKELRFARLELVEAALLDCPQDGVWSLSDAGWSTFLRPEDARALVTARRKRQAWDGETKGRKPADRPTTGPRPVSHSSTISRNVLTATCTYVLRFGGTDIWKIGHAGDLADRLSQVNKHVPHELLDQRWAVFTRRVWPDAPSAYAMEQRMLDRLERYRTVGERVRCSHGILIAAWRSCLSDFLPAEIKPS